MILFAVALGCGGDSNGSTEVAEDNTAVEATAEVAAETADEVSDPDTTVEEIAQPAPTWDPEPVLTMDCDPTRVAPLMDAVLEQAGLARDSLTFSADDYAGSHYYAGGRLDDPFLLPGFRPTQAAPLQSGCFAAEHAGALDVIASGDHPVATIIRRAARQLDRFADGDPVLPAPDAGDPRAALALAIAAAVAAAGASYEPPLDALAPVPADLAADLVPVFVAMADALAAHQLLLADASTMTPRSWVEEAGFALVPAAQFQFLQKTAVQEHLLGEATLPPLFLAAARVAYAVESVDWSRHRGLAVSLALNTPIGRVEIRGPDADTYPLPLSDAPPTWFLLDTGGDDRHQDDVGATTHPELGISLAIDLGGDDHYGYDGHVDRDSGLMADEHGRYAAGDPATSSGAQTRSRHGRQGSGRHGIGMLFDLGGGADVYDSLAASQGYAALGVGVLFDDGGRDTYHSEVASQGSALCGIGILIDLGGDDDRYHVVSSGQGMAGVRGVGVLFDQGGDDDYEADPGPIAAADPDLAPQPLYWSPQMPGRANSSMSQGASTGIRWDAADLFFSGGIGILRDAAGDDNYRAGLFAQGAGYWQGIGLLSDGGGRDHYDALYYVQGAGAHYAVGMLMDGGNDDGDWFNQTLPPQYVQLGSGHDFTLGVLVNETGDDVYSFAGLAAGASNCNGIGLFVDNAGDDLYVTGSDYGSGLGNVSDECFEARPLPKSVGLMLDAGGTDTYRYPDSELPLPTDGGTWGHVTHDLPSEHGAGLDADGESGVHAP